MSASKTPSQPPSQTAAAATATAAAATNAASAISPTTTAAPATAPDAGSAAAAASGAAWSLLCWNVNGLRAVMKKGFLEFLQEQDADIVCLQEIKVTEQEAPKLEIPYAYQYYNSAEKKGYSGTAIFSRHQPLSVSRPFDDEGGCCADLQHPREGRVLTLEFADFFIVNVYVPNSQDGLRRLDYRTQQFDRDFRAYLQFLDRSKPVVVCGDFNVAHKEIDIARPKANVRNPGFTDEERTEFTRHLGDAALLDTFRQHHGDTLEQYTWWSYRGGARERNVGWRIDYFLVSARAAQRSLGSGILQQVHGSDHCPISLRWQTTNA